MRRDAGLVSAYVKRVIDEVHAHAARWPGELDTVYLGGGTPSHLSDSELDSILAAIARAWGGRLGRLETTLEADPKTFDRARAERWRDQGVTRLSLGVQSTQAPVLKFLGRQHDGSDALDAIAAGLSAGLWVSADVMTAVPGQDAALDLTRLAGSGAQHLSVYSLTIETHTPFARRGVQVDEDRAADDFDLAHVVLREHGFERYEVSNHARPGFRSLHNPVYWRGDTCMALGPGAAGLHPPDAHDPPGTVAVRVQNPTIKGWLRGEAASREALTGPAFALELLMTGLRTLEGINLQTLQKRTGVSLESIAPAALARNLDWGTLTLEGSQLRASEAGVRVLNSVLRPFFAEAEEAAA